MTTWVDNGNRGSIGANHPTSGLAFINADGWDTDGSGIVPANVGPDFTFLMCDWGFNSGRFGMDYPDGYASGSANVALVFRYVDDNNWWRLVAAGTDLYLQLMYLGSLSDQITHNIGSGVTTIEVEAVNYLIRIYVDGSLLDEFHDSFGHHVTATKHGLVGYNGVVRADNWSTSDEVPPLWETPTVVVTPTEWAPTEPPGPTSTIGLAPAVIGVRGGSVRVDSADAVDPGLLTLELFRHPDYLTPLAELATTSSPVVDGAFQKSWQDRLNEPGSAEFTVPWQSDILDLVEFDDLVRISYRGEAVMMMVVDDETRRTIAATERDQTVTYTGPGHLNLLSEAVVYPALGIEVEPIARDRLFNWTSPELKDGSWPSATVFGQQNDPTLEAWQDGDGVQLPEDFPDPSANWVGPPNTTATGVDGAPGGPGGFWFGRRKITVPTTGTYIILFAADNAGWFYLDGAQVLESDGWRQASLLSLDLTAGDHQLAWSVANEPITAAADNPTAALWTVAGYNGGNFGSVVAHSGSGDKATIFPGAPPGMTPGEVLRIVLTEAQFRGELTGWTWTFDDYVDSNGTPWPSTQDIGTKVGTDYLAFIGELVEAPWIDVRAQPGGLVLDAYVTGTIGDDTDVEFHPPTDATDPWSGNITELTHQRRSKTATRLLIGSQFPWRHVDATPGGERVKTATLGLGAAPSPAEVDRIGTGQLDTYANVRSAFTLGIRPAGEDDSPYLAFRNGDVVDAPDVDGTPAAVQVKSITGEEDENGVVTFGLEVNDVFVEAAERYATTLKKMANGTLQGDHPVAKVATPINQLPAAGPTCCPPQPYTPGG